MVATSNLWMSKVNVDGSVSMTRPRAAIGGVMRGLNRGWIGGFEMMTSRITKEARGGMEQLIIHVDPPTYVRDLLVEDVQRASVQWLMENNIVILLSHG
ncbi:hypothetical protein Golax_019678 [Gossypium laxum]|uniref:Uncharacterized protein n=1 Tax=Gossypium laxum TaxID=34288 RepID=A0A7J8Z8S4_9ROSI|nr:hypothetical protein [Gossypium laxum]